MKFLPALFSFRQEENVSGKYLLVLSTIGPFCLLLGLVCTLLKCSHHLWPIPAVAFLGFLLIWQWKKYGFIFSLCVLSCVMIGHFRAPEPFWPSFLSASVALSWLLLFLGHQEALCLFGKTEAALSGLKSKNVLLGDELEQLKRMISLRAEEMGSSIDALKEELKSAQDYIGTLCSRIHQQEEVNADWRSRHDALLIEIEKSQCAEKALEHSLNEMGKQLLESQHSAALQESTVLSSVISQEEDAVSKSLEALEAQYAQLKEQFEEKSEVLYQTRKQLFAVEGQFLILQKEIEEKACSFSIEDTYFLSSIQQMTVQCEEMEFQVEALEECISTLVLAKKTPTVRKRKKAKNSQEDLFLMIEEKISKKLY